MPPDLERDLAVHYKDPLGDCSALERAIGAGRRSLGIRDVAKVGISNRAARVAKVWMVEEIVGLGPERECEAFRLHDLFGESGVGIRIVGTEESISTQIAEGRLIARILRGIQAGRGHSSMRIDAASICQA